jgi:hypothetical protein
MSIGDYFAWEQRNPSRHEYVAGEVYAMSGATVRHNLIALNLVRALHGPARARGCVVLASDVQLRAAADRVYYPDVMLACGAAVTRSTASSSRRSLPKSRRRPRAPPIGERSWRRTRASRHCSRISSWISADGMCSCISATRHRANG